MVIEKLVEVDGENSLRYAAGLSSLAAQNAKTASREKISSEEAEGTDKVLLDIGETAEYLKKYEERLMVY